jgi:hypothetical protein
VIADKNEGKEGVTDIWGKNTEPLLGYTCGILFSAQQCC